MFVTTIYEPDELLQHRAMEIASQLNCQYIPRRNDSLAKLSIKLQDDHFIVITNEELRYYPSTLFKQQASYLTFHPSMAFVRIKRLLRFESDYLMECSCASQGDIVLDCTAGLASDAIVFSHHVGDKGKVIGLESQQVLALLLREGLLTYNTDVEAVNEAMRRIQIIHTDHKSYLKRLPDNSIDVIYFDPMFRIPVDETSSIKPFRSIVNHAPIEPDTIAEAMRVARKSIVLKEHRDSPEFARLGFQTLNRPNSKVTYGVIYL